MTPSLRHFAVSLSLIAIGTLMAALAAAAPAAILRMATLALADCALVIGLIALLLTVLDR